jgi:hypothetical protein
MGQWQLYAQRAETGLWLDNDVQLDDFDMDWTLSGPAGGEGYIPAGLVASPYAMDGRLLWEKWGTLLFAEEDKKLAWVGICLGANPDEKGIKVEFIGVTGWLQRVPYNDVLRTWERDVFDVIRHLVNHSKDYKPNLPFTVTGGNAGFTVGDPQPPEPPKEPVRRKGESKKDFRDSKRYEQYQEDAEKWNKAYGKRERFEIVWWEAPYIGEEIDTLAKEHNFDYRENVKWINRTEQTYEFILELSDDMTNRRTDIALIDGQNLAEPLETKDIENEFANHVIGLGKGEGRDMRRAVAGGRDGRLYQAEYITYKSVKSEDRLRRLISRDHKRLSNPDPEVGNVVVWDIPGWASVSTLRCGDEVQVISDNTQPRTEVWRRIVGITRSPVESVVALELEAS